MFANLRKQINKNLHISQGDFTQQHDTDGIVPVGAAVVSWLGHHVREVDAFTEHVARHRRLRGRDAETWQTNVIIE